MTIDYERDAYGWAFEQAALLRSGRLDAIDAENIAEEIETMGRSERRALTSQLARLYMHLIKWEWQPERRSRSWILTIRDAQRKVQRTLRDNPSLKGPLDEIIEEAWQDGSSAAIVEAQLDIDDMPDVCPWTYEEALAYHPQGINL